MDFVIWHSVKWIPQIGIPNYVLSVKYVVRKVHSVNGQKRISCLSQRLSITLSPTTSEILLSQFSRNRH